jgi:hypothetical protein
LCSSVMEFSVDVVGAVVVHQILAQCDGGLVVDVELEHRLLHSGELADEHVQLHTLTCCCRRCNILSFTGGGRHLTRDHLGNAYVL